MEKRIIYVGRPVQQRCGGEWPATRGAGHFLNSSAAWRRWRRSVAGACQLAHVLVRVVYARDPSRVRAACDPYETTAAAAAARRPTDVFAVERRRRFRSHRVRCGGPHGRRWRHGNARPGPGDGGGGRGGRRRRPVRRAPLHEHGVAGPAGSAEGPDHQARHRTPVRPGGDVPGRAVRVPGAVHAARRVAHVVPEGGRRVV